MGFGGPAADAEPEPPADWTPSDLGVKLVQWLRADMGVTLDGSGVESWDDQSGDDRLFLQLDAAKQPTFGATYIGGRPAIVFDGSDDILDGDPFTDLAGNGSAELFIVMQLVADPPVTGSGGSWQLGSPNGTEEYVPLTNGQIYAGDFSTVRKSTAVNMGADFFTSPRIFSVSSKAGEWKMYLDGVEVYTTATNTFAVGTAAAIGGDPEQAGVRLCGGIGEVLIASPMCSTEERAEAIAYFKERYTIA